MRYLVGIDDTDSSRGFCTTYLAYRIAVDLWPGVAVLPYPRLVRLNPNIPFKTRGNAAVCLQLETRNPAEAFGRIAAKVRELSDVQGGANSGMVFIQASAARNFRPLYLAALKGVVNPHAVRRMVAEAGGRTLELGNGMGLVGAASSLGFDEEMDHTFELIAYRQRDNWGTHRIIDSSSVKGVDAKLFPRLFNSYDYQKRKVLIAPHGPDPVFVGIRGDSPSTALKGFRGVKHEEQLEGHMLYLSNQHTDAHLSSPIDWKVYSSGWALGTVASVSVGEGGHVYMELDQEGGRHIVAAYEPTGDLMRTVRRLHRGDRVRAFGGVRRGTSRHPKVLNLEKLEVVKSVAGGLPRGIYVSSPRANRHLTKPLIRYGREDHSKPRKLEGWLSHDIIRPRALA